MYVCALAYLKYHTFVHVRQTQQNCIVCVASVRWCELDPRQLKTVADRKHVHSNRPMYTRHDTNRTILSRLAGGMNWAVAGVRSDSGSSFISRPIIVTSRRQQGLSRRCTTMSTAESTPPEVFKWTGGIISTLVEPRVSWTTRGGDALPGGRLRPLEACCRPYNTIRFAILTCSQKLA